MNEFRAGFAALLGKPNAGKSTLLNEIVGQKLAAVSALPQTTREKFSGIYSDDERQIVFVDLPGLTEPDDRLNEFLRESVFQGLQGVDVVIHLADVDDPDPLGGGIGEAIAKIKKPVILVVTKLDGKRATTEPMSWAGAKMSKELRDSYQRVLGLSSKTGRGKKELIEEITACLHEGPPMYDPEILTDRDMRFLAQEMIREKVFYFLHQELPYATAVLIDEFKERNEGKWYVAATIYVERDSQKGMVIGKKGEMLKRISAAARRDIEQLCDHPVFLELWVKVRDKWRKNDSDLRYFGYDPKKHKS